MIFVYVWAGWCLAHKWTIFIIGAIGIACVIALCAYLRLTSDDAMDDSDDAATVTWSMHAHPGLTTAELRARLHVVQQFIDAVAPAITPPTDATSPAAAPLVASTSGTAGVILAESPLVAAPERPGRESPPLAAGDLATIPLDDYETHVLAVTAYRHTDDTDSFPAVDAAIVAKAGA